METKDLIEILKKLAAKRPIFHSECDFQHELAMLLQQDLSPNALRLERPYLTKGGKFELDIFLETSKRIGIELKYKTKGLKATLGEETFHLKSHAALGSARFDYLFDIERLEVLKRENYIDQGYAIILTNDTALYTEFKDRSPRYEPLYLDNKRQFSGTIDWGEGTIKERVGKQRMKPINLKGTYIMNWQSYSEIKEATESCNTFKYIITTI